MAMGALLFAANARADDKLLMTPHGDLPLILQKAGGLQGIFCYTAFAPTRGVGAFVAINKFDFGAAMAMAGAVNNLIGELAPR